MGGKTKVELTDTQCVYVRELLFQELHEAATVLVEQAFNATQGNADKLNIAGDDAHGTWRQRVQVVAGLLDTVGWSVATDAETIVALERARIMAVAS
jgi:hypothetical protein